MGAEVEFEVEAELGEKKSKLLMGKQIGANFRIIVGIQSNR